MKYSFFTMFIALAFLLFFSMPWNANQIFISSVFANDEKADSVSATDTQNKGTQAQDDAVLEQLKTLLSEDYCPNNGAGNWDWNIEKAAPECLLEQAKKIRLAVFGPSEFSDEEEQKLRKIVANGKEVEAKWNEIKCKPGVVEKWVNEGQVGGTPECLRKEIDITKEHNRKNGTDHGRTLIQDHVFQTKLRHLEDMDKLNYLLAQVLYQYSCDTDIQTREDCVSNFYNSIKSQW